jgi:hypothetical protein
MLEMLPYPLALKNVAVDGSVGYLGVGVLQLLSKTKMQRPPPIANIPLITVPVAYPSGPIKSPSKSFFT